MNTALVQNANEPRLRLDFPTFENVEYEVRFRRRVTDPWTVVPFALSANDPAEQTSLVADGNPARVFVERTTATGFYTVAIRIIDLTEG